MGSFWGKSSVRSRRILTVLVFFLLSIVITVAGVLTPLSLEDSKAMDDELKQIQDDLKGMNVWQSTVYIFTNNFKICLLMFIPIAGPFIGSYILYNTGLVIGAESRVMNMPGLIVFVALFLLPHAWLEFAAYSMAFAASVWLTWQVIKRQAKRELLQTCKYIAICALLLFVAGFIEAYLIASFPQA